MRVLIYCPVYRLEAATVDAILTMDHGEHTVQVLFDYDNPPGSDENSTLAYKYSRLRSLFKLWNSTGAGWDAVLFVESDIVPPKDTLLRLINVMDTKGADVAFGHYSFRRSATPVSNCIRYVEANKWVDQSYSHLPEEEFQKAWKEGVVRVSGLGHGIVLINADVMHNVEFQYTEHTAPDWPWANSCLMQGYKIYCDLGCPCGHIFSDGRTLWPTNGGPHAEKLGDKPGFYFEEADSEMYNGYHCAAAMDSTLKMREQNKRQEK